MRIRSAYYFVALVAACGFSESGVHAILKPNAVASSSSSSSSSSGRSKTSSSNKKLISNALLSSDDGNVNANANVNAVSLSLSKQSPLLSNMHATRGGSDLMNRLKIGGYFALWYALNIVYNSKYDAFFLKLVYCS